MLNENYGNILNDRERGFSQSNFGNSSSVIMLIYDIELIRMF